MNQLKLKYILELVSNIGQRAQQDARQIEEAQQNIRKTVGATKRAIDQQGTAHTDATKAATTGADRIVGAQRSVQQATAATRREIDRLVPALQQVDRTGSATLQRLNGYMSQLARGLRAASAGAMQVGAGATAGAYAADRVTKAPMDYSMRLAQMANTAFADRDAAGRIQGKGVLDAAIRAAVRTGGGKIDDAAGTLDSLIASGAVSREQAIKMLPMLMRASTASGASAEQLGSISLRGMQSFGIGMDQVPEVLNMAMAAGQAGGFELKDMAKWLPQAMAMGKQSGLSGIEGMRRIMGSMQASVITSGSKDEAGNNVVNLLGKVNSADTAKDFKKLGYDLPSELARMRGKGMNSLDAFVSFVDEIASKDKEYMALKNKLKSGGTTAQKAETMQSMADILQGKAVGQVIQDRQALMALVAEMNNRGYVKDVMDRTRTDRTAVSTAFDVISQETGYKKEQATNEVMLAGNDAFSRVAPAMNKVFETSTDVARQFPLLTTAAVGSTAALGVFAAALGGGSLAGLLRGGTGAAGGAAAGGIMSRIIGGLSRSSGALMTGARAAGGAAVAGGAVPALAAASGAWGAYQIGRLGMSLKDLYDASTREGVVLSAHTRDGMGAGSSSVPNVRGQGYRDPRLLALTGPAGAGVGAGGAAVIAPSMSLGKGEIRIVVDAKPGSTAAVVGVQDMPAARLSVGNTNPAGYATGGPR